MSSNKTEKIINRVKYSIFEFRIDDIIMLNFKNIKTIKFNDFLNYKNFDSFKIIRVINKIVYKFEFFDSMKNIFSIFHS